MSKAVNDLVTKSLVQHDTVQAVEDELGRSLNLDSPADGLLMLHRAVHDNKAKNEWLESVGDTTLSMEWHAYFRFVTSLGFKVAKTFSLYNPQQGNTNHDDVFVFYREDGLVLVTDTWTYGKGHEERTCRNGAKLHFALKPTSELSKGIYPYGVSGGWESESEPNWRRTYEEGMPEDAVFCGYIDGREALSYNLRRLSQQEYEFAQKWPKRENESRLLLNFLVSQDWRKNAGGFLGHEAERAYLDNVARRRIKELPQEVLDIINLPEEF